MAPGEEITAALRAAIDAGLPLAKLDIDWWQINEIWIDLGRWRFFLFIEANYIYDIYAAVAPDGRRFDFQPRDRSSNIGNFLREDEVFALMRLLGYVEK